MAYYQITKTDTECDAAFFETESYHGVVASKGGGVYGAAIYERLPGIRRKSEPEIIIDVDAANVRDAVRVASEWI